MDYFYPIEMPNVTLANQEMADTLPVSSSTDWVAAFSFKNKEVPPEDDLGIVFYVLLFLLILKKILLILYHVKL